MFKLHFAIEQNQRKRYSKAKAKSNPKNIQTEQMIFMYEKLSLKYFARVWTNSTSFRN